ncbi:MAG: peptidoglycan DD-metalloendopeptidase family protein [Anaerolineae bacterium]|nr:peptidoglycan DD-metalloendopeptidase family protein [Anaerolineae bacterium]MBT7071624.1 peptidoglycan DD-metalloendopeptidase family protein [Anaerolineae bacterium]MBT7326421.1 peptidoglycan DD-metalloendopeptidase family protein [Anaerolineae bacterium]
MMMKPKYASYLLGLLILFSSLLPIKQAQAAPLLDLPPFDMFQLPWEQGLSWVTLDGLDNGTKRGLASNHNYLNGGAVDFTPRSDIREGDDTSNYWVTAAAAGTVIEMGTCHLKIDHSNGWITEYQFLANFQVALGDAVYRNQRLAIIADGIRDPFCPPALYPDIPHLHFSLRPTMVDASFSGWNVNYDSITNLTTLVKEGQIRIPYDGNPFLNIPYLQIAMRGALDWNLLYRGSLDAYRYERWTLQLADTRSLTLTATPVTAGLEPLIVLLDENGVELAQGIGTLSTTQPAGSYFVQIQPQTRQGFYDLVLRDSDTLLDPYIAVIAPANINMGETTSVEAYLGNIPVEGYTSVEITCPYDSALLSVITMAATDLFGTDPVIAVSAPENESFIFAIAGSSGQKALQDGTAFTFNISGLAVGQTTLQCTARISTGSGTLLDIIPIGASISISDAPITNPDDPPPDDGAAATFLAGQVLASKPVTIALYDLGNNWITSVSANLDGTFQLGASAGTYTVLASASGFLPARGAATLVLGQTTTMPTIALLAGDIDGNLVIDQFDAMTIGMNYNASFPDAADLNADATINVLDLEALAANYRASGVQAWQ